MSRSLAPGPGRRIKGFGLGQIKGLRDNNSTTAVDYQSPRKAHKYGGIRVHRAPRLCLCFGRKMTGTHCVRIWPYSLGAGPALSSVSVFALR